MNTIALLIASAGMGLGFAGPDGEPCPVGCEQACCTAGAQALDEGDAHVHAEGVACTLCASPKLPQIDSAAYGNANWPEYNNAKDLYSKNLQGQKLPVALGTETILSEGSDLKQLQGKVVIVDFWATWCGPCIAAAPKLASLQKANSENLMVVGLSGVNEDEQAVRSFLAEHDEPFMQLFDANQTVLKEFESRGIPLVVVMSTDGVIRWMGNPHESDFKAAVEQVLKADPLIQAKS